MSSFPRFCRVLCFSLLAATILSACTLTGDDATPVVAATETSAGNNTADSTQTASAPTSLSAKPERPLPTLHDMIGLDRDQVTALLGKPHFRRHDKPADLWQYRNKKCALDLFLYRIRDGIIYKVTHADVRILNSAKATKNTCFKRLIKHHIEQVQNNNAG